MGKIKLPHKTYQEVGTMSDYIVTLNQEVIHTELKDLVRKLLFDAYTFSTASKLFASVRLVYTI